MRATATKGEVGPDKLPVPATVRHQSKIYGHRKSNTSIDNHHSLQGEEAKVRPCRHIRTEDTRRQ